MRNNSGYKLETIKIKGVWFKGQYAKAYHRFEKGEKISMNYFDYGSWEATKPLGHFINVLVSAEIDFDKIANSKQSLRTTKVFKSICK
jgi:hypothetical protein